MKNALITLGITVAVLFATILIQWHRIDGYKHLEFQHQAERELLHYKVKRAIINERLRVTDSLVNYYQSLPPVVEVIEVVKWKHDKVADSVVKLSDSLKIEWIKSQIK